MQSLRSNGQGTVIEEKITALPAAPPPSRQSARAPTRLGFSRGERTGRRYGVLDDVSDSGSSEMIILQRRSEDQRGWDRAGQKV
jgi:hypothetical protein